jgi:predicted transcriptional regulator
MNDSRPHLRFRMPRRSRIPGKRLARTRTFRMSDELDKQLKKAAKTAPRSISAEIEYRLERSFWREEIDNIQRALDLSVQAGKTPEDEERFAEIEASLRDALQQKHGVWRWRVGRKSRGL